jgi:hypothetical protein
MTRYDAYGEPIVEQQTCIECGAPVNEDGEFENSLVAEVFTPFIEHGYTCGLCNWGRADQPRTYNDYTVHIKQVHPHVDWKDMR